MISKRIETLAKKNSAIRAMFEEGIHLSKIHGKDNVFDFSLGNPIVEPPSLVKESILETISKNDSLNIHGYMLNSGYQFVRESVANQLNKLGNQQTFTKDNIVMTVGAAGGLNCVLQALLNPDDEVLVIAPFFVEYVNYIENWGGKVVIANADHNTFTLSLENISLKISQKTKAIILNNPNNPTGVVYSPENIQTICDYLLLKEKEYGHPIYIISDEPYRELAYDGTIVPFLPDYFLDTIIVYSWSKSLSLPGERIGYVAISPLCHDSKLLFDAICVCNRIIGFVNAPSLMQYVVNGCIEIAPDLSLYNQNRVLLYKELTKIGFECVYPQGAFYLWVKAPCEESVFVETAKALNLLLVGGRSFCGPGYVRIAYCVSTEQITRSIPAFKKLWDLLIDKNK